MVVTFVETTTSNGVQSARVRVSLNGEQCEGRTPNVSNARIGFTIEHAHSLIAFVHKHIPL